MRLPRIACCRFLAGLAALSALSCPVDAQVYKWTGPDGRTHYGDRPPEDVKKQEVRIGVQSFGGPAEIDRWTQVLKRPPVSGQSEPAGRITLFTTSWCPHCKRAKAYLAQKGVSYREVDIEASAEGLREFRQYGGPGVPLVIAGEHRMRGFSPQAMDRLLAVAKH